MDEATSSHSVFLLSRLFSDLFGKDKISSLSVVSSVGLLETQTKKHDMLKCNEMLNLMMTHVSRATFFLTLFSIFVLTVLYTVDVQTVHTCMHHSKNPKMV